MSLVIWRAGTHSPLRRRNFKLLTAILEAKGFPDGSEVKASACICPQCGRARFNPWIGKMPWRRKWQPTPVFLPGESHGWRSLVGYSPLGRKEWDTTELLHFHFQEGSVCSFLKDQRYYELTKGRSGIQTKTWHCL